MKVDKTNGGVNFCEESHIYWDENGRYDSVTTVIGKFEHEYDKDFWSAYKALEKLLEPDMFSLEKKKLLETKKFDRDYYLNTYSIDNTTFDSAQQDILDEWAKKNAESCERGTAIHAELERSYVSKKACDMQKFGLGGKFRVQTGDIPLVEDKGVYPEYLVHYVDGNLRLAGQIDLLIKDGCNIIIVDYKTNKKLDEKSFFNSKTKKYEMMKYPIQNIMDCNKMHYTLQLSTYAWMLQKNYPELEVKKLILIHYDHNGNVSEHEVDYLKSDVERMLNYWKTRGVIEKKKELRKPIEF